VTYVEKILTKATTLFQTSFQSEACTQSYGASKLGHPKVTGIPTLGISRFPFGSPRTKCHLDMGLMERQKIYYNGEGGGFPQVRTVGNLVSPSLPVARPKTKVLKLCTNQLVVWFV
jgi:hypothetical protein